MDCLGPFEDARRVIHPKVVLPEPLYSRCRALRASILARDGDEAGAAALIAAVVEDGVPDADVRSRIAEVAAMTARRRLDAGDFAGAEAALDGLDRREAEGLATIRAAIETARGDALLANGDEDGARRCFAAASAAQYAESNTQ